MATPHHVTPAHPAPAPAGGARRLVRTVLTTAAIGGVAQGIFVVLFVPFVARVLHGDAAETGLLRGVQAIGSIAAGLLLGLLPTRRLARSATATTTATVTAARSPAAGGARSVLLTAVGAAVFGVLSLVVWNGPVVTRAEPVYVLLFVLVGAPGTVLETGLVSTLQNATADGTRGRVFGLLAVVYAAGQATGELGAGLLGDRVGVLPVVNVQACLYLVGGLVAATALRRRRHRSPGSDTRLSRSAGATRRSREATPVVAGDQLDPGRGST